LSSGQGFPGYKLVAGRSTRRWGDDAAATEALVELLGDDAFAPRSLLSPSQAESALGKKRKGEIAPLIVKPEGKPTLAPESDPRPAVSVSELDFELLPAPGADDE